jgi:branched-chain amino acid transport system permease protein
MSFTLQLFQFFVSGLTTGSTCALIAIGFSIIHNATGIVNFAQGEFVMLGGMFMVTFHSVLKVPLVAAFFLAVFCVAIIGLLLFFSQLSDDLLYTKPLLHSYLSILTYALGLFSKGRSIVIARVALVSI